MLNASEWPHLHREQYLMCAMGFIPSVSSTALEKGLEVCWEEVEGLQRNITLSPWVPDLRPKISGEPVSMRLCHISIQLGKSVCVFCCSHFMLP